MRFAIVAACGAARVAILGVALLMMGATLAGAEVKRLTERVFLVPDKPGTGLRFEMIVNAGAMEEPGGDIKGIAHYLEHLILVGRNPEHGDAVLRMFADGSANGWTSDRATAYLHDVPPRPGGHAADLERLFGFYAARLKDFNVTEADAARERNVVLQEHDLRTQSNPTALFYRDVNRRFIPDHPAGGWNSGSRESIKALTLDDAHAFHRSWYGPNNVWFVIRTPLEAEKVKEIAEKALAGIPDRETPERTKNRLPRLDNPAERFVMRHPDIPRTTVYAGRMGRVDEPDLLRRQAALSLLGAFVNSRFAQGGFDTLVETRRVAAEDISFYLRRLAPQTYALTISAGVAAGHSADELETAINAYLDQLAVSGLPNPEQLARLKKRIVDQFRRADGQPPQEHARLVSWLADGRAPERLAEWPAIVESISFEEIKTVAAAFTERYKAVSARLEPAEDHP